MSYDSFWTAIGSCFTLAAVRMRVAAHIGGLIS